VGLEIGFGLSMPMIVTGLPEAMGMSFALKSNPGRFGLATKTF